MQERRVVYTFNQNLLKAKIVEKGKTILSLAAAIGICEATFYRKMGNEGSFSRFEINEISKQLELSKEERDAIFFN